MSWNIHYKVSFVSIDGDNLTVNIYEQDYSGEAVQLTGAAEPFTTSESTDDDLYLPVRTQSGYIRIIVTDAASDIAASLMSASATAHPVTLTNTSGTVLWVGFLKGEQYSQPWKPYPYQMELPVCSVMETMSGVNFTQDEGFTSLASLITLINSYLPVTFSAVYPSLIDSTLQVANANWQTYMTEQERADKNTTAVYSVESIKTVMEDFCQYFGVSCRESGASLIFYAHDGEYTDATKTALTKDQVRSASNTASYAKAYRYVKGEFYVNPDKVSDDFLSIPSKFSNVFSINAIYASYIVYNGNNYYVPFVEGTEGIITVNTSYNPVMPNGTSFGQIISYAETQYDDYGISQSTGSDARSWSATGAAAGYNTTWTDAFIFRISKGISECTMFKMKSSHSFYVPAGNDIIFNLYFSVVNDMPNDKYGDKKEHLNSNPYIRCVYAKIRFGKYYLASTIKTSSTTTDATNEFVGSYSWSETEQECCLALINNKLQFFNGAVDVIGGGTFGNRGRVFAGTGTHRASDEYTDMKGINIPIPSDMQGTYADISIEFLAKVYDDNQFFFAIEKYTGHRTWGNSRISNGYGVNDNCFDYIQFILQDLAVNLLSSVSTGEQVTGVSDTNTFISSNGNNQPDSESYSAGITTRRGSQVGTGLALDASKAYITTQYDKTGVSRRASLVDKPRQIIEVTISSVRSPFDTMTYGGKTFAVLSQQIKWRKNQNVVRLLDITNPGIGAVDTKGLINGSGGSGSGSGSGGGSGNINIEQSQNSNYAKYADEAGHAQNAANLDTDSPVWTKIKESLSSALSGLSDKFLSKTDDDTAKGLITFVKGLVTKAVTIFHSWKTATYDGDDSLLGHGAMVDENGRGVMQSLKLREFLSAPKFVFNEINVTKAEQWNTNAYGTIESIDTKTRQITLHLEDNEYGSVQVGDICRGIYADIGNEYGTDSNIEGDLDDCNFVIHKGFFTTYFAVEKVITNEKGKCIFQYRKRTSATPDPCPFMDFAQYGSFTDSNRQSSMYMSSLGHSYYEVLDGVNNWEIQPQNRVARYGWLGDGESKGLTVIRKNSDGTTYTQVLKGNGLFAQNNVYFGDAVIELSNISNLDDLQKMAGSYDIALSQYQGVLTVDDRGNVIRGLYSLSASGVKQWRLATTVFVRRGTDILLEEDATNETVTEGHYRVTAFADGCDCEIANSTIYITGIKNIRDGVTTTEDEIDYDEMRKMTFCRVTIVVELEGKTSKTIEFPIRIVHDSLPFMVCDLSNEHDSVSYNTKTKQYAGFPVETVATLFYHNEPWQIDADSHVDGLPEGLKATVEIKDDKKMYVSIEPDGTKEGDFLNTTGKDGTANVTHRVTIHVSGTYAGAVYEYSEVLTLDRGCDVTVYDIVPSEDSIIRKKDGTMSVSSLSVEIWATSTDDKRYQVTDLATAGLKLLYGLGGKEASSELTGDITIAGTETEIKLALISSADDNIVYDTETIPVVAWGEDGKGVEFIYWTGDKNPGYPVDDDTVNSDEYQKDEEYVTKIGNGWSDDPVDPTAESPIEYVSVRKSVNGVWGKFSYPAVFAMFSKSVTKTNSLYGVFGNGVTPASDDGGFSSDGVTDTMLSSDNQGKYIWSVDEVTYNDGKKDRHNVSLVGSVDSMNEVQEMYTVTDSVEDEPTSDVKNWGFTDGGKAAASATKEGQALWNCDAVTYKDGTTVCINIQCIGTVGRDGRSITGSVTKYAACATDSHPGTETTDSDYTDWQDDMPSLDDDHPWLHVWTRYTYSREPLTEDVFTKSKMGIDGNGAQYIYKRAADVQTILNAFTPTDWLSDEKYQTTDGTEYVPDGWTDNPSGVTKALPYEYVSMRIRGKNGLWGAFSTPAPAYLYPRSIKSVDTYYAVATTGTTLTSDNFADYSPTTVLADTVIASNYNNNMSVWSADKTTYSYGGEADEVQYLNVTCLGTCDSLASVTEQYGISSDTSTYPADSTVSATPPTGLSAGQCIWSRDHIVWRSGTPASTDTAWQLIGMVGKQGIQGEQGEQGDTGNGISYMVIYYGLSASGDTQPSSWSTLVQTPTDSQPWLWVRTRIYYTYGGYDDSYTKSYKGSDGDEGHSPYISNGYWYYYSNGSWVRGEKAQGEPGGTGAAGPIIRTHLSTDSDMTSGSFTFLPGDGYEYVDCIFYTPTKTWYQCVAYYTGSFSTSDTTHFKAMSSYTALATQLFLADNAKVNLLASQQINLMSGTSESTIWGSFRHVSDTGDYALWLGASSGASAPFSVKGNGLLYAKGGTFEEASVSGTFTTGSGDGKITISATDNIGTINVGGWIDIGYNSTVQRPFGNLITQSLPDYGGHISITSKSPNYYFGTSVNSYTTMITGLTVQTNFLFANSLRAGSLALGTGSGWASSSISTTLQGYINNNLVSLLVMSNTSTVTVNLPSNPVTGQIFIVVQRGSAIKFGCSSKSIWSNGVKSSPESNTTGQWNFFVYDGTYWTAAQTNQHV